MESLGRTIHDARKAQKKTLHVVSEQVGVSPGLLSLIEQNKHIPPKELIVTLAEVLNGDANGWCALIGKITPDAEAAFAQVAKDRPIFFRKMVEKHGGTK
jgi:transcriptional regulator with XRE-family HTH domain